MTTPSASAAPDARLVAALVRGGLVGHPAEAGFEALAGGVSSDIWKVTTPTRTFCVKRALAKLKVAAVWQAPVERDRDEGGWRSMAHGIVPGAVPGILLHDVAEMCCAMT